MEREREMPVVLIPREIAAGETRVAAVPDTVRALVRAGLQVTVEAGAGLASGHTDAAYAAAGARVGDSRVELFAGADIVAKVGPPGQDEAAGRHELELMREGAVLVGFLHALEGSPPMEHLLRRRITAFAMERIPRLTRAQAMDALSSQASIAGYKAALLAACHLPRLFPMLMTAAGTITPARVVVLGAGVAGLQALATAHRLGAVVEVSDVRLAVREQVASLGGRFIEVEGAEDLEAAGGYAREASREFLARQREVVDRHLRAADAVITTAAVPGRPAPRLVSADTVRAMRPGAVIVDLAVEQGGNCELSVPGEVVQRHGVTIVGLRNLPATVPVHASAMYARNVQKVLEHLCPGGELRVDLDDEITGPAVMAHRGEARAG